MGPDFSPAQGRSYTARSYSPDLRMALNFIWIGFILIGFAVAAVKVMMGQTALFGQMLTGLFDMAKTGFDISLGLVGVMTLWLGIMKIGEQAGVIEVFARGVAPFFRRIFPGIPDGHPASGSITMNASANMLGLDNAATPLGLKAMA
jgi:spore maturation protein SpmA